MYINGVPCPELAMRLPQGSHQPRFVDGNSTKPRGRTLWELYEKGVLKSGVNEVKYENNYQKRGRPKTRFASGR